MIERNVMRGRCMRAILVDGHKVSNGLFAGSAHITERLRFIVLLERKRAPAIALIIRVNQLLHFNSIEAVEPPIESVAVQC
jgi:hypothetical protein